MRDSVLAVCRKLRGGFAHTLARNASAYDGRRPSIQIESNVLCARLARSDSAHQRQPLLAACVNACVVFSCGVDDFSIIGCVAVATLSSRWPRGAAPDDADADADAEMLVMVANMIRIMFNLCGNNSM